MNFLKSFLAALLALTVFSLLGFFALLGFISIATAEEEVVVSEKSVLYLDLDVQITEQEIVNPLAGLPIPGNVVETTGLLKLKDVIKHASENKNIEGIYLKVNYPLAGFSTVEEIRQSILEFRETGKWVIAYAEVMTEQAYYLASAADQVFLNPEGEIEFNGIEVEINFFKRLFEKLEIKPEVFRVGDFKSAVEPFVLEKMSAENRLQLDELINSIYDHVLTRISETRDIPVDSLREISRNMLARSASLAVEYGLIDKVLYDDEVQDELRSRLSIESDDKIKFVKYKQYKKIVSSYSTSKNEIAVIVADGTILNGKSDEGIIGSTTIAEEIRKARKDDRVKAIVLRVNSPGGSFQASDIMWREVTLASEVKPIIASMSDYAASGGYYIAMGCDTIVAQPHTITGSIGIFSVLFDASGLLENKLGITSDRVRTGEFGQMVTFSRPLSEPEKRVWQTRTDEIYETFTKKAAEGRLVELSEIKKVASGRVWTGDQALQRNLVDVLGGYNDAIRIAAEVSGITDDYRVRIYPEQKISPLLQLLSSLEDEASTKKLKEELGDYYGLYLQLQHLKTYEGVQARMPFEMTIH